MAKRRVNPPLQVELVNELKKDPLFNKSFYDVYYVLDQLRTRTGGGRDFFDEFSSNEPIGHTLAKLFDIREQIGSGIPVTIDTTGFTIDTTEQTTDMTEV